MQNNENFTIPAKDNFQEAFAEFEQSRQFDRLQEKYQVRPFFQRAKPVKLIAEFSSYLLNVFSAATAFAFVFFFLKSFLPFTVLAATFTAVFLVILEGLKRLTLPAVFKAYLQFKRLQFGNIAFAFALSAASITSSFFGAKEVIRVLTPEAVQIDLQEVRRPFQERIDQLQDDKTTAEKQTYKGKITRSAAKRLEVIQEQIAQQQTALLQAEAEATRTNTTTAEATAAKTGLKAEYFALAALLFELLLFLALWYVEFYDFRSLAEYIAVKQETAQDITQVKQVSTIPAGKKLNGHNAIEADEQRTVIKGFANNVRYNAKEGSCLKCNAKYQKKVNWQKFCSEDCRLEFHAEAHGGKVFDPKLAKKTAV